MARRGNPWLGIDAATTPSSRARAARQEWEQFVGEGRIDGMRAPLADSWRRSLAAGVDPSGSRLAPLAVDRDDAFARWRAHPLAEAAPLIRSRLASLADASEHLIVISDANGMLLQLEGDARVRSRAADSMNFTEGALWSEHGAGTNAIGTALAADHAVQIFATEHFVEVVQAWTCSAAPVHDPETGELLGVIDLTGRLSDVHPHSLAIAMTTARAVEGHLRSRLRERDELLRRRFERHLTGIGERRALTGPGGQLVADDPRGWLDNPRVELPPGGGELVLPSGARAYAEPIGRDEAVLVREVDGRGLQRLRPAAPRVLADEQAALRRLATAAAQGVSPDELFAAVTQEIAALIGADDTAVVRFESDRTATVAAAHGASMGALVSGSPFLLDDPPPDGSAVACQIVVEGRRWGAVVAARAHGPLPADTEERMANPAELVGVVIANAESRAELAASRARAAAAGDEARRRVERDLHDGAQARLVNTVLALKLARRELGDDAGQGATLLDDALTHAQAAHAELRELAH